jgi:tetratricopeptide (TPR) repeat protein
MIQRFRLFLGPTRLQTLFLLLAFTGLGNLILNVLVEDYTWVRDAQTVLVFVFLIGTATIIVGRLSPIERGRWTAILVPAFGALIIGTFFVPKYFLVALGLAVGWIIASMLLFKGSGPVEYKQAVRHLRKNRYAEAVKELDALIKQDAKNPAHYHFRAEIFRVWGRLNQARNDYTKMTRLDPNSAMAYNGLAEIELQAKQYDAAHQAAIRAQELAPNDWVALYNLGTIEDRLGASEAVIEHLEQALEIKISDSRHRSLAYLFLARAYSRLGDMDAAGDTVKTLKRYRGGLNEWQVLLQSDQAKTLRDMLGDDVETALALVAGKIDVEALADG